MHDGSLTAAVTSRYGRKREAIVAAATEILNRRGVKGMTLAQVAERVGLITTSVTYYFKKKEDLASACFFNGIERLDELVLEAAGHPTVSTRLHALLDLYLHLCGLIQEGEEPPIPVFSDILALEPEHQAPVGDAYLGLFRRLCSLFCGRAKGDCGQQHFIARAHILLEQLHWSAAWLHRYDVEDYPRIRDRMHDILMHGLAQPGASWAPRPLAIHRAAVNGGEAHRETFLVAATRLINQRGYRGASVEKMSASLNVTKGSFYHHHQAKDDVVETCFHRTFEVFRAAQAAARALDADEWTQLAAAAAALVEFQLSEQGPLLRTSALSALPETIRGEMVALSDRVSDRWAAMISDGIANGSVRPVDPFIAAQMLNATLNAAADLSVLLPGVGGRAAADLYAQPLLMGFGEP
jgi:AcrR family transcriptional regulator